MHEKGGEADTRYRVFFGDVLMVETLSKVEAAANPRYRAFFNVNGHFKQQSTILTSISSNFLPTGVPADTPAIQAFRNELHEIGKPSTPKALRRFVRILEAFERPSPITRYVKNTRGRTCQLCGDLGFVMRNGQRYCEAHHVFQLSKNPPPECLAPEYLVILCATCHRRMHYAKVGEPVQIPGGWRVVVDGKPTDFVA